MFGDWWLDGLGGIYSSNGCALDCANHFVCVKDGIKVDELSTFLETFILLLWIEHVHASIILKKTIYDL